MREVGEKLREYIPDITETEIAKRVSKSVSDAETKIMENTNIYQYGGFKSKSERDKLRERIIESSKTEDPKNESSASENPE